MLNFGAKKKKKKSKKTQGKNCLQLNFQPGYCEDVNSVVRQTEKQVEITGETEFWRISQKSQVWNFNNTTGYPWEKKNPENVSKLTNLWFKRTKNFVAIRSEM